MEETQEAMSEECGDTTNTEFTNEEERFLDKLELRIDDATKKIVVNTTGLSRAIDEIRNQNQEFICVTDNKSGIEVRGASHTLGFDTLQQRVHQSISFIRPELKDTHTTPSSSGIN